MKKILLLFITFISYAAHIIAASNTTESLANRALLFMENKGQVVDFNGKLRTDVKFTAHSNGVKLFITSNGIYYQFAKSGKAKTELYRMDMQLMGANSNAPIIKENKSSYNENYFLATCPKQGITDVTGYSKITYQNIYPNIDWVVYAHNQQMEYDFVVHPGGNPNDIKIKYDAAKSITINKNGSLSIATSLGQITEGAPLCWSGENKKSVAGKFILTQNTVQFKLTGYDKSQTLTIDPTLNWSMYFGGGADEKINKIINDGFGGFYVVGYSTSASMALTPTTGYQIANAGLRDAFYAHFDVNGQLLIWSFIGGTGNDEATSACLINDRRYAAQNLVIAGTTTSTGGIPTSLGFKTTKSTGIDIFVTTFLTSFINNSHREGEMRGGSYLGGTGTDVLNEIVSLGGTQIGITGQTSSSTGITANNTYSGATDGFIGIINFDTIIGGTGKFSYKFSYIGGSTDDYGTSIAVDKNHNLVVAGYTSGTSNISTSGTYQPTNAGGYDGFIRKVDTAGLATIWSTYYGGTDRDEGLKIALDTSDNIFVTGMTSSDALSTAGAYKATRDSVDLFLAKFSFQGNLDWCTYFGSTQIDYSPNISVDFKQNIILSATGTDTLATRPLYPFQPLVNYNGVVKSGCCNYLKDAYLAYFSSAGNLQWSSYFGGEVDDYSTSVCTNSNNVIYLAGYTSSPQHISRNFSSALNGATDGFIAKIFNASTEITSVSNAVLCAGDSIIIHYQAVGNFAPNTKFIAILTLNNGFVTLSLGTDSTGSGVIHGLIPVGTAPTQFGNKLKIVPDFVSPAISTTEITLGNIFAKPAAIITPQGNTNICQGGSVVLNTISGAGLTYQWKLNGADILTANSNSYEANASGNYEVTIANANGCDSTSKAIAVNVIQYPTASISYSGNPFTCPGDTINLTANAGSGLTYQWQKNATSISSATTDSYYATSTGTYSVIVTQDGLCADTSVNVNLTIDAKPAPQICLVSVDSSSTNNIIYWDKTSFTNVKEFLIYRDIANNNYQLIGTVPFNALSSFTDTVRHLYAANGDPNATSWRYKIAAKDTCNHIGPLSNYHQTISFSDPGTGTFTWSEYKIEGEPLPVSQLSNYKVLRDSLGNDTWRLVGTLSASSVNWTDINYDSTVFAHARWRTDGVWNSTCTPTLRTTASVSTTRSNIKNRTACITNTNVSQAGDSLIADASGTTYQWLDCNNSYTPIVGETSQSFTATQSGSYAVKIGNGGCTDTSACFTVTGIEFNSERMEKLILLLPNPAKNQVIIHSKINSQINSVQIIDNLGRIVLTSNQQLTTNNQLTLDISSIAPAVYTVSVKGKDFIVNKKLVICE